MYKASGISQTQARQLYGFENMNSKVFEVEQSLLEAQEIDEAIDNLAHVQDEAFLATFGVHSETESELFSSDNDKASDDC